MLTACSGDEDSPSPKPDALTDTPVSICVSVDDNTSRAGYSADNLPTAFMLFLRQNTDKDYSTDAGSNCNYNYANVFMALEDNVWTPKNMGAIPMLWKNSSPGAELIAYTLQDETMPDFTADAPASNFRVEVLSDQTSEENFKKSDWLSAIRKGINPDSKGSVKVEFSHELSRLRIILEKGTEISDDITFESVTIDKCCRMWTTADLQGNAVLSQNLSEPQEESISMLKTDAAAGLTWEGILIPQTIAALSIRIVASDGQQYVYTAPKELEFATQRSSTLKLKIGYDKVTANDITTVPWTEGSPAGDTETE